ncbi:MAG: dihydrofolate synthase [Acidimicrobiia bacterium]|nr:MAG: dihydrofolate synthase [Acidimicrobiia bacterium]
MTTDSRTVRAWLERHWNVEAGAGVPAGRDRAGAPTLERIRALLALLGSPEREYPAVHLTGTNGKTSTARMVATILREVGLRVGTYTSPDLSRVNERIELDGQPIGDAELDEVLRTVALAESQLDLEPSYFEVVTAAGLRWFADVAVDVAVVEVGLGGTWDATNVIDGRVAVVTNVAIDHVEYLGPTREQIASEKAGIVKPGSVLVLGETDPDLRELFVSRGPVQVLTRDADFGVHANALAVGGRLVDCYTPGGHHPDLYVPLHGAHQADNAVCALAAAEAFVGRPLDPSLVAAAFAQVRSPGRLEVAQRDPLVLLDGAHNVAGAQALRRALAEEFAGGPRTLVVGLLREKEPHEMLAALGLDDAAALVCCRPPSPRALDPSEVARAAVELGFPTEQVTVVDEVREAVATALVDAPEGGQIVVTGSLYVVGAARTLLVHE